MRRKVQELIAIGTLLLVAGCQTVNGRRTPFWAPSWATPSSCEKSGSVTEADQEGLLVVEVRDSEGEPLPGATLQISEPHRPHNPVKVAVAQEQGIASVSLVPGRYRVQVIYPACETYTTNIEIEGKGENCRVIVSLAKGVG